MSFLKKIFQGEGSPEPKPHVERSPRIRIPSLDHSVFLASDGRSFPLRNISETGIAIATKGEALESPLVGEISMAGEKVATELEVVRRGEKELGLKITKGAPELRALFRRIFADEIQALQMSEVDSSRQKEILVGQPRWFYAPGNYELFYVEHKNEISRFELEWNGNVLAYSSEGLRFGTIDREIREEVSHARSSVVNWMAKVDPDQKQKALRLLENIPGLSVEYKGQMQRLLGA